MDGGSVVGHLFLSPVASGLGVELLLKEEGTEVLVECMPLKVGRIAEFLSAKLKYLLQCDTVSLKQQCLEGG